MYACGVGSRWEYGVLLLLPLFSLCITYSNAQFMNLPAGPVGALQDPTVLGSNPEKRLREEAQKRLLSSGGGLQAPPTDTVSGRSTSNHKHERDTESVAYMALKESKLRVERLKTEANEACGLKSLNLLLSFAVGSLLGDVFLHILPETWNCANYSYIGVGLWIIAGLLACFLIEKACASSEESQHRVTAIMNLVANLVDNFTHGLAVGGSFLVSIRFGVVTTFAIVLHEIPHEISDFAILLRADYDRRSAVKAQLLTAIGGIAGAVVALACHDGSLGYRSAWILPFTAGGFLNIALVQVLPELLSEKCPKESVKQMCLILIGILTMGVMNQFH